jgi:hypothetical protein
MILEKASISEETNSATLCARLIEEYEAKARLNRRLEQLASLQRLLDDASENVKKAYANLSFPVVRENVWKQSGSFMIEIMGRARRDSEIDVLIVTISHQIRRTFFDRLLDKLFEYLEACQKHSSGAFDEKLFVISLEIPHLVQDGVDGTPGETESASRYIMKSDESSKVLQGNRRAIEKRGTDDSLAEASRSRFREPERLGRIFSQGKIFESNLDIEMIDMEKAHGKNAKCVRLPRFPMTHTAQAMQLT